MCELPPDAPRVTRYRRSVTCLSPYRARLAFLASPVQKSVTTKHVVRNVLMAMASVCASHEMTLANRRSARDKEADKKAHAASQVVALSPLVDLQYQVSFHFSIRARNSTGTVLEQF